MSKFMNYRIRIIALAIMLLVLAAATYGFANTNTVPDTAAGEGDGAISGFTITNVHFTLDSSDPSVFSQLTFDISPTPTVVRVGLADSVATVHWFAAGDCSAGATVTCTGTFPLSVRAAYGLHVAATQ